MVKWAVELSEFDIKYEPRGPIKGHIFADFVVELSSEATRVEGDDFCWVLSVDGSSNQQGSGAGVILEVMEEGPSSPHDESQASKTRRSSL